MRGQGIKDTFVKIKKWTRHNLFRVIVYGFLFAISLTTVLIVISIHRQSEKNALLQERSLRSVSAFEELEKRKTAYQTLGMDVTAVQEKSDKIYQAIYSAKDYSLANNLIGEANSTLDELYAKYLADKQQKAEEALKGDLLGKISCAGTSCKVAVNLTLSVDKNTAASTQADVTGNYTFRIAAGIYNLSVSASGYKSAAKTNVSIISQKQTTVNLNLEKIVTGSMGSTGGIPSGGDSGGGATTTNYSQAVIELSDLINNYRQSNGLTKLSLDPLISRAAANHSNWMSSTGIFSHTGENRSLPWNRCAVVGTTCSGEIIYTGSSGPNGAFNGWKNSPPHNTIMLESDFNTFGIGIAGNYYTADFR